MTESPLPAHLDAIFRQTVARFPEAIALDIPPSSEGRDRVVMDYAALDREVDRLATLMCRADDSDPSEEALIGLLMPRTDRHLLAAQLAAGRIGRPWTYLDPGLPDARLQEIISDGEVRALVVCVDEAARAARVKTSACTAIDPADTEEIIAPADGYAAPGPDRAAYVIYTSGSSGRPKGVVIEQRGIVNLVLSDVEAFGLGPEDRCAQGSSAAYDSYLEEVWLALAVGAAVVVLDDESIRLGPDLPELLRRERITVLCPPPTLLRTMGLDDPRAALPDLHFLYVGGEALPADVAAAWAPGRRLENGYGPTECTVTVMRTRVPAEGPITIGRPVPGHRAFVMNDELEPLPEGEIGELCIAGPGLARGYLGRPELTAERFPHHPEFGRLYRTGDLVRRRSDGDHEYLGRADAQVKVRGHRIELGEIETRLVAEPGVREAACTVQRDAIVAWLVADADLDLLELEAAIACQLPAVMCPAHYGLIDELPRTTGGKVNRRALPEVEVADAASIPTGTLSDDAEVAVVQGAFAEALRLSEPPPTDADFFGDLGGHSLAAALAVTALRRAGRRLTVRDLYECPRAEILASRMTAAGESGSTPPRPRPLRASLGRRTLTTLLQSLFLLVGLALAGLAFSLGFRWGAPLLLEGRGVLATALILTLLATLLLPLGVIGATGLTLIAKRLLIGRFREGSEVAYGSRDLRRWVVARLAAAIPFGLLRGSGLDRSILRLLGAEIGRGVWIDRGVDLAGAAWDLLRIGDGAVIGRDAVLGTTTLDRGRRVFGTIEVGEGAVLETRAGMAPGSRLGAGARLRALSFLPEGEEVAAGVEADGVPAMKVGSDSVAALASSGAGTARFGLVLVASRMLVGALRGFPAALYAVHLAFHFGLDASRPGGQSVRAFLTSAEGLLELALVVVGLGLFDLLFRFVAIRTLGRTPPGRLPHHSGAWLRRELRVDLLEGAGRLLSGTMFWPVWLRAAGMRIGNGSEVSSIHECVPDEVQIGAGCFFADGVYLGAPRHEPGHAVCAGARLGDATFVGNHAVLPGGTNLPDEMLIGISTPAPSGDVAAGSSWFGHPAMRLPQREIVTADRELTHEPGFIRRLNRAFWELARFLLPWPNFVAGLGALTFVLEAHAEGGEFLVHALVASGALASAAISLCLATIALKWLLLGRMRSGQHALWSCWCSRWDFLYVAWQVWAVPIMVAFEGTLWLVPWLRAFGVRVGRGVTLGRGFAQVVDPDMLRFEDGATVSGLFQAHSFEDRVLKLAPVHIRTDASTEFGSVMLYGADLEPGARLRPHSVAMKYEALPAESDHLGVPSRTIT